MTIGEKIAKLRKQAGLSQEAFSEKLGISRQAVSKWENGTAQPTNENLAQIARLFDVTISSLLDDEDINMGSASQYSTSNEEFVENIAETKEIKIHTKALKISSVCQSAAIIILSIATIAQGVTIGSLKNDLEYLTGKQKGDYSTLQSQISSLENRMYYNSYPISTNDDFTDYHYSILDYDIESNIATLHFSVVPKDYTRDTQAKIVIKGREKDYSVNANMVNNIFVADAAVYCEDGMDVYLYLTENGKTRSFILDKLENPASKYILDVQAGVFDGEMKVEIGKISIEGNVGCTIASVYKEDLSQSVYPVKATIGFYNNNILLKELPFTSIMQNDFLGSAKHELSDTQQAVALSEVSFFEYFDFVVEADIIKSADSQIAIRITVVDNNGHEYISDVKHFEIGGEVKEVITPKAIEIE